MLTIILSEQEKYDQVIELKTNRAEEMLLQAR